MKKIMRVFVLLLSVCIIGNMGLPAYALSTEKDQIAERRVLNEFEAMEELAKLPVAKLASFGYRK